MRSRLPARLSVPLLTCLLLGPLTAAPATAQRPQPRASAATTGTVVDSTGAPMARVPVRLIDPAGRMHGAGVTDRQGRFTVPSTCDVCAITASLPGFQTATVRPGSGGDVTLTLAPAPVEERLIVTATRDTAPSSQVGASTTVLDAAAITRRGDALVGDLLREVPGVTVVQSGGRGSVTSLFVRGGENTYTKVLLDGIPLNEPGGTFNFGGLTTAHIARVELIRGAQSAVFGSDAMAGVLQLFTARGTAGARPSITADLSGGGYGSGRAGAGISGGTDRTDYSLHVGSYRTDNRGPNHRLSSTTVSLSAGAQLTDTWRLRLVGRVEDGEVGTPGQTAFGRPDMDASFLQRHAVGGLTLEHRAGRTTQRLSYALATSEQRSTNLLLDPPYTPSYNGRTAPFEFFDFAYDSGSRFRRHHASYQGDLRLAHGGALAGAEIFTIAVDWDGERGTLRDYLNTAATSPSRNNVGATVQHQHVSARLAMTTGVRLERNASFGTAVVPRLSAAWLLRHGTHTWGATSLKGNAGTGIKEPTLRQSFSLSPFDLGNPDLEAERSRTLDIGLEQRLAADRVKLEAVWFTNVYRNQISTRTISFSPYMAQYVNVGRTEARGLELSATIVPMTGLRVTAAHTVLASEIIDATSEFSSVLASGQWALRRPRHAGHAALTLDRGRLSADVAAVWQGRRNDSDFSSLVPAITSADGHVIWRSRLAWHLLPQATLEVRADNLTDVDYMEPLGYPAWRRTLHAGLRLRF